MLQTSIYIHLLQEIRSDFNSQSVNLNIDEISYVTELNDYRGSDNLPGHPQCSFVVPSLGLVGLDCNLTVGM